MPSPNPNAFAHYPLDRAGHRRRDAGWLKAAREDGASVLAGFLERRPLLTEADGGLSVQWLGAHAYEATGDQEQPLVFLGVDGAGAAHFACELAKADIYDTLGAFHDLRAAAPRLPSDQLSILGCAKAILEWHGRNRYCSNCGAPSFVTEAGWKRECHACGAEHFPRVDPVVIMLPTFGEACLLGRQKAWPRGMHSALAGYVEPGETPEQAVARETLEEAGLVVTEVRLHSTQPWPFPSSLMIGAICEVAEQSVTIDPNELESARWFTREEARRLLEGGLPDLFCPPPVAIAHQLLRAWVGLAD